MVAHCASVAQAIEVLRSKPVDVVLLDYDLGGEWAPQFLAQTRELGLAPKVLMVTAGMPPQAVEVLRNGASGVFLKHNSLTLLAEVIRKVAAGETWVDQRCVQDLVQFAAPPAPTPSAQNFTDRERQVLRCVFDGLANKEIGGQLGISESAVKSTLQQLFQKTGVHTRSQLVRIALERFADESSFASTSPTSHLSAARPQGLLTWLNTHRGRANGILWSGRRTPGTVSPFRCYPAHIPSWCGGTAAIHIRIAASRRYRATSRGCLLASSWVCSLITHKAFAILAKRKDATPSVLHRQTPCAIDTTSSEITRSSCSS